MSKVHYAQVDRANESNTQEEWSNTACGLKQTQAELTENKALITCKNCRKRLKLPSLLEWDMKSEYDRTY